MTSLTSTNCPAAVSPDGKRSIGDTLDNYRQQYGSALSARKITEPLVRALYWKREMWMWKAMYDEADKPSFVADVAADEFAKVRKEYRAVIRSAWGNRSLERAAVAA